MLYVCVVLFLMWMGPYIRAMDAVTSCSTICRQEQSAFVQLPNEVLCEIAQLLPQADVARTRQTCKFLNKFFVPGIGYDTSLVKIRADDLQAINDSKNSEVYWDKVFGRIVQRIAAGALSGQPLVLDLSGVKVERFMFVDHPECKAVRKLVLQSCAITSERDNFFKASMWACLKHIDLTNNFLGKRDKQVGSEGDWDSGADIWPSLSLLPNLKVLILCNNRMSALPSELFKMKSLTLLDVRDNPLTSEQVDMLARDLSSTVVLR